MRKLLVLLAVAAAAIAVTMVVGVGSAFGDPGKGRNNPMPDNPPCDADHSHPGSNVGKCQDDDQPPPPPPPPDGDGAVNRCTAATGDPGLVTDDTLGQTLWDGGLKIDPLTEDPEGDGAISKQFRDQGEGTQLEPLTDEIACAVDLLLASPLPDL